MKVLIAYIPVPHEGYRQWFLRHKDAQQLYILGGDFISEFPDLAKDIRALPPLLVCAAVRSWNMFGKVMVLSSRTDVERLLEAKEITFVMPSEEVSREFQVRYLLDRGVVFDSVFLRWDRDASRDKKPVQHDRTISVLELDRSFMRLALRESEKGSDWWRRVGAVLVRGDEVVIVAHGHHLPTPHTPYIDGDPRSNFKRGIYIELSTAMHAEASVIAEAARRGVSTAGAFLYVTTFPCPPCAKLVACSGIKRLYFAEGYGILDGEAVLKSRGVEIILVAM